MGEVPEALDAQIHQTAADLFRTVAGHTEHCDLGVMLGTERLQLVDMADLDAADLLAHLALCHIKGGDQAVAVGVGGDKAAHCLAQTAAADQDGGQAVTVAEQQAFQNEEQVFHRVADALPAIHIADAVEVLPYLRSGGAHLSSQLAGRNAVDAVRLQRAQIAVIFGKTLDNGKRSPCRSVHRILSPFALSQYLPQLPALQMRRRETPIRLRVHIADITVNYLKYTAPMENVKSFSKKFYEMLPLFCCSGSA